MILHKTSFPEFEESFAGDRGALCTFHLKTRLKLPLLATETGEALVKWK